MSLIAEKEAGKIREILSQKLEGDVLIDYFGNRESPLVLPGRDCEFCRETRQILEEIAALSPKLRVVSHDVYSDDALAAELGVTTIPAFVIRAPGVKGRVRYFGVPAGYEFATLLEDIVDASRGTGNLAPKTREAIASLDREVRLQVFVGPTCPYCPTAARIAHRLAIESEHVVADVIESSEFPAWADRYGVTSVPYTIINETHGVAGAMPEARFVTQLMHAVGGEPPGPGVPGPDDKTTRVATA